MPPVATHPIGVALSLATSVLWAISPLFIASVGRRIGSFPTNLLRALLATGGFVLVVLPIYALIQGGLTAPTWRQVMWLSLSGFGGMVLGDAFFYEALVLLGPRRAVKINTLAPVVALSLGWIFLGEKLTGRALVGAGIVIAAVMYATFVNPTPNDAENKEPGAVTPMGLVCGFTSALFVALGAVLARQAYKVESAPPLDGLVATTIRVGSATAVLWMIPLVRRQAGSVLGHLKDAQVRSRLLPGAALGAFAGMTCYISALRFAPAGLVSTLVATSPLVIIPLVSLRYKTRLRIDILVAAAAAVAGVGMISLRG